MGRPYSGRLWGKVFQFEICILPRQYVSVCPKPHPVAKLTERIAAQHRLLCCLRCCPCHIPHLPDLGPPSHHAYEDWSLFSPWVWTSRSRVFCSQNSGADQSPTSRGGRRHNIFRRSSVLDYHHRGVDSAGGRVYPTVSGTVEDVAGQDSRSHIYFKPHLRRNSSLPEIRQIRYAIFSW